MLENYLIKGLMIGIVFGVPAGAVGVLSVQRGITYGPAAGFITGIGSSVADVFYACVGVFGITFISDFLLEHQNIICTACCLMVTAIGIREVVLAERAEWKAVQPAGVSRNLASCFATSLVIAIANPAGILSFIVVFSMFRIVGTESLVEKIRLIAGIFSGTCVWWLAVSLIVSRFRSRITGSLYTRLNRIFGILMILLGTGIGIRMLAD